MRMDLPLRDGRLRLRWRMKLHRNHRVGGILAVAALLPLGMAMAESVKVESISRDEVRERVEPMLEALDLSEERKGKLVEELEELHSGEYGEVELPDFGDREGAEKIRGFMVLHGFTPQALRWLDEDANGLTSAVRILHARRLLREGPPELEGHWPKWNEGDVPGKESDKEKSAAVADLTDVSAEDGDALLESFVPKNAIYEQLQKHFSDMEKNLEKLQDAFEEIPPIQEGEIVKSGESYEGAEVLARRLKEEGYFDSDAEGAAGTIFTEDLSEAVKRFQQRNGRAADGILGPNTLTELNRSPEDELEVLRINLHRARLLPDEPGERHIIVNIPSTQVFAFEGESSPKLQMKVIVGKTVSEQQTPVFRDVMETLEFAPPWNVPISIAKRDIVPKARENAGYLEQNRYEIVADFGADEAVSVSSDALSRVEDGELFIRQKPGPGNSLGNVKFLFPNDYAIYLHDTPKGELFEESERDFSNGCIRVEDPAALAEYVLGPQGWDKSKVEDKLDNEETEVVEVENPLNVYIIYLTAFPEWDDDGSPTIRVYPDLYELDGKLLAKEEEED